MTTDGGDRPPAFPHKGLICVQAALLLFAAVAPFGFDKPSSWGLDFGHFLLLASVFGILALVGLIGALALRKWKWLGVQAALVVIGAPAAVLLGEAVGRCFDR